MVKSLFKNPAGIILVCIVVLGTAVNVTSCVTGKRAQYDFQAFADAVTQESLTKAFNAIPSVKQMQDDITEIKANTTMLTNHAVKNTLIDLQKYYRRLKGFEKGTVTDTNIEKLISNWSELTERYKTDESQLQYDYVLSFYGKPKPDYSE